MQKNIRLSPQRIFSFINFFYFVEFKFLVNYIYVIAVISGCQIACLLYNKNVVMENKRKKVFEKEEGEHEMLIICRISFNNKLPYELLAT